MKKSLRLLLLLVGGLLGKIPASAQTLAVWCPPGAVWEYSYTDFAQRGTLTVRYANDTVVAGQTCQVLRRVLQSVIYPGPVVQAPVIFPSIITRLLGDNVSFWHNGQFVPLYQFGALPGNSWTTYATYPAGVCPQYPVQVTVDSVGRRTVNGVSLRWQVIHCTLTGTSWRGRLYEGIGSLVSLQPNGNSCPNTDPGYISPLVSFRATGFPAVGGPRLIVLATAETRAAQAGFTAYPNPTTGLLTVQVPAAMQASQLSLHDLLGRCMWQQPLPASRQVNLGAVPPGVYLLAVQSAGQAPIRRRVVVQ